MTFYLLILLLCMGLAFCYEEFKDDGTLIFGIKKSTQKERYRARIRFACLFGIFGAMTLTMGLRAVSVGTDTVNYYQTFMDIANGYYSKELNDSLIFYSSMQWVIDAGGNFQQWLLLISTVMSLFIVLNLRLSKKPWLFILLFFVFDYTFKSMNIMRQMLGMLMISYVLLSPNKNIYRVLLKCIVSGLAIGMHLSVIVFFIAMLVVSALYKKVDINKQFILLALVFFILLFCKELIIKLLEEVYPGYINLEGKLSTDNMVFLIIYSAILIFVNNYRKSEIKGDKIFLQCANLYVCELAIYSVYYVNFIERGLIYFNYYLLFLFPYLFTVIKDKRIRQIVYLLIAIALLLIFVLGHHGGEAIPYAIDAFWK